MSLIIYFVVEFLWNELFILLLIPVSRIMSQRNIPEPINFIITGFIRAEIMIICAGSGPNISICNANVSCHSSMHILVAVAAPGLCKWETLGWRLLSMGIKNLNKSSCLE